MKKYSLTLLTLSIFMTGCGGGSSNDSSSTPTTPTTPTTIVFEGTDSFSYFYQNNGDIDISRVTRRIDKDKVFVSEKNITNPSDIRTPQINTNGFLTENIYIPPSEKSSLIIEEFVAFINKIETTNWNEIYYLHYSLPADTQRKLDFKVKYSIDDLSGLELTENILGIYDTNPKLDRLFNAHVKFPEGAKYICSDYVSTNQDFLTFSPNYWESDFKTSNFYTNSTTYPQAKIYGNWLNHSWMYLNDTSENYRPAAIEYSYKGKTGAGEGRYHFANDDSFEETTIFSKNNQCYQFNKIAADTIQKAIETYYK